MAGESLNICQIEEKAIAVMSTPDRRVDINQDGASKQIRELAQMHKVQSKGQSRITSQLPGDIPVYNKLVAGESNSNLCKGKRKERYYWNLVCLGDLLELCLRLLLVGGVLVRVPSHGELPVGLLEVVVAGAAVDAEDLVVVDAHLPGRRRGRGRRLLVPAGGARGRGGGGVGGPTLGWTGLSNLDRPLVPPLPPGDGQGLGARATGAEVVSARRGVGGLRRWERGEEEGEEEEEAAAGEENKESGVEASRSSSKAGRRRRRLGLGFHEFPAGALPLPGRENGPLLFCFCWPVMGSAHSDHAWLLAAGW